MQNLPTTSYNQLSTVGNRFQGSAKRVLCCCSAGILRSPTAANVLHREFGFNTRACGIDTSFALIPISEALLAWAEEAIVMDKVQEVTIKQIIEKSKFLDERNAPKVICLNIPDSYGFMEEKLQNLIIDGYKQLAI